VPNGCAVIADRDKAGLALAKIYGTETTTVFKSYRTECQYKHQSNQSNFCLL
jgi:hypothetical protein